MRCPKCGYEFKKGTIVKIAVEDGDLVLKIRFGRKLEGIDDEEVKFVLDALRNRDITL